MCDIDTQWFTCCFENHFESIEDLFQGTFSHFWWNYKVLLLAVGNIENEKADWIGLILGS